MNRKKYTIEDLDVIKEITPENIKLLEESKELILKMKLFTPIFEDEYNDEFKIIHDFERANFYAFEENYGEEGNWTDLKEGIWAEVYSIKCDIENYIELDVSERINNVCYSPVPEYTDNEAEEVYNEIDGDFTECLISRLLMGKNNKFLEDMFKAYLTGGWPCGWEGNFPEGRMIVYYPKKDD